MVLEELVNLYVNVANKLIELYPTKKKQINRLLMNLSELTTYLVFEKKRDKNFKYPGTEVFAKNVQSV